MSIIIYLKMKGERQGDISAGCGTESSIGNRFQLNHENEILAFSLTYSMTGTGKGINLQGLRFSKLIDKSSPLLTKGITDNEKFFLEFCFYRTNHYGKWEKYYYIELRGATLSAINTHISNNNIDTEVVEVRYEYILCKHLTANTEFSYLAFPADYNSLFSPRNPIVAAQHALTQLNTLNSKGVGRLLAAGGIYNGNVVGFRKTAEQLGGNAPAGYDEVLNETTKGVVTAAVSVAAALGLGRMGAASEIGQFQKVAAPPEALAGGAARAQRFSQNWPSADLGAAVNKFAGSDPLITITESGKQIYTHPKTGIQVVEDLSGNYFRINDPSLPGKRTYLDLDGNIPNNRVLETGKLVGRTQSEYNEVTHFNIYGGE